MDALERARFMTLFEGSPGAVCILRGPELTIDLANAVCLKVWGKTAAVIGQPLLVGLPELAGQGFDELLLGVMRNGVAVRGDETLVRIALHDAAVLHDRYFDFCYAPMCAADGTIEGVFAHGYDVTERVTGRLRLAELHEVREKARSDAEDAKRLKDALSSEVAEHEDAARFRLLVESVKDYAIFMLDPQGRVASWNAGAERIKGYASGQILGKHFSVFYPPEDVAAGKCEYELEVAARDGRFEDEGWRIRKDGTRLWANVVITALRNTSGTLVGFAKVTQDLTQRRATEETLRNLAVEKAELAEKARVQEFQERFIAILGHDLRNPLAAIEMGAGVLRQRAVTANDTAATRVLDRMKSSSRRMSRMIEQILDLTRSRLAGGLEVKPAPMDMCDALTKIVDESRTAHPERTIDLRCAPLRGAWDQDRLEQVFSNLVSNAIHYGIAASPVIVEARDENGSVVVEVHNGGLPIAEELRAKIFSPFRRGERDSRRTQTAGLGLGLYISHEIVVAHGGEIAVRSNAAEGTTFRVTLPYKIDRASSTQRDRITK